jgi:hypothetical protein
MENVVRVDQSPGVSRTNEEPRTEVERLHREHNELKARLSELNSRLYLSPDEEIERKQIQKLKLIKKDRLAYLTRS